MSKQSNKDKSCWNRFLQTIPVKAWIGLFITLAVALVLLWVICSIDKNMVTAGRTEKVMLTPTQIKSIESIGEWEFLAVSDEEIVDTVKHGLFSDAELIRIYYGTLRLGIDLGKVRKDWLRIEGDTLYACLPQVCLLDSDFIDEARTRTFYETGTWTPADRKQLYLKACRLMRKRVMSKDNVRRATLQAEEQLEKLLHAMGVQYVRVTSEK